MTAIQRPFSDSGESAAEGATAILAAAQKLFAEKGFSAVSISEIAQAANVSKANVFHHFQCKEGLYVAVLRDACDDAKTAFAILDSNQGSFEDRLRESVRHHMQRLMTDCDRAKIILRELIENRDNTAKLLAEQVFGQDFARFVEILRAGQRQQDLRADFDPAALAVLLFGANIFYFLHQSMLKHFPEVKFAEDSSQYVDAAMDIFLRGVSQTKTPSATKG
jgi:TetR/AcrR family transcriptional regulator